MICLFKSTIEGNLQFPIENYLKCLVPTKHCEISDPKSFSVGFHNGIIRFVLSVQYMELKYSYVFV